MGHVKAGRLRALAIISKRARRCCRSCRRLYAAQGLAPQGSPSPEDFAKFVFADFERIGNLMKVAGIKPE
jgi:tripartite-type tricarboxylate transporter receptor subunit TctC